jgi:hypothetical protein
MIKFTLDYIEVDPALNWQDINFTIKTEKQYNLFLQYQEYTLDFGGSGFAYLYDKINNDTFCESIPCEIFSTCDKVDYLIFSGAILLTDCEVNERTCTVKCKVVDKSFFSKINNNKTIKTALDSGKTKNGEILENCNQYTVDVYSVLNNNFKYEVECARVWDAFNYMIGFMSDNTISFKSDAFAYTGIYGGIALTTGYRMRKGTVTALAGRWQQFSFLELYQEVNKRIPLVLMVEDPYGKLGKPVIRIEPAEYRFGAQQNFNAVAIDEIITSFDTDKLYAKLKFGSPVDYNSIYKFPEAITFYGFREEEFHLLGTCNLDLTLDLTANWIVSSNLIEKMVQNLDQSYDSDIVMLSTESLTFTTGRTTNTNFINTVPAAYYYNELLNNDNISKRYGQNLSAELASYYASSNTGEVYAFANTPASSDNAHGAGVLYTVEEKSDFLTAELYDYGNYFDTTTHQYTAQETAVYNFEAKITFQTGSISTGTSIVLFQHYIAHYDSAGNLKTRYHFGTRNNYYTGLADDSFWAFSASSGNYSAAIPNVTISMVKGDYIKLVMRSIPHGTAPSYDNFYHYFNIQTGDVTWGIELTSDATYLRCTATSIFGGIFNNVNPNNLRVKLHKFNYPMTEPEWLNILNNPIGNVKFAMDGQKIRNGWIQEIKYSPVTGQAQFTLNTSKDTENGN